MADLKPLIRYRKHGVDEKRRVLAQLYDTANALKQEKKDLLNEIEKEKLLAEDLQTPDVMISLGSFTALTLKKIEKIDENLESLEVLINVAQEEMREAFADMKKVEITQRNREEAEDKALSKKEAAELDEIGIDQHRRNQNKED